MPVPRRQSRAAEDRDLLMGHARDGMSQHYAAATLARLLKAANSMSRTKDRATVLRIVAEVKSRAKVAQK